LKESSKVVERVDITYAVSAAILILESSSKTAAEGKQFSSFKAKIAHPSGAQSWL
jgi:hypothetical protein